MSLPSWRVRFLRFAFHHFYNSFAWTYDVVSALVSLGHWRAWTRAAIPYVRGARVLEVAFGTGNLQLAMRAAGLTPFGLDLSPNMVRIAARKLRRAGYQPQLARGSVFQLPFASGSINSLVLTFPPGFLALPPAVAEMRRVLSERGRIVVVDAGWVRRPRLIAALINLAFRLTGTADFQSQRIAPLHAAGFQVEIKQVGDERSTVQVLIAEKINVSQIVTSIK